MLGRQFNCRPNCVSCLAIEDLFRLFHAGVHDVRNSGNLGGFFGQRDQVGAFYNIQAEAAGLGHDLA